MGHNWLNLNNLLIDTVPNYLYILYKFRFFSYRSTVPVSYPGQLGFAPLLSTVFGEGASMISISQITIIHLIELHTCLKPDHVFHRSPDYRNTPSLTSHNGLNCTVPTGSSTFDPVSSFPNASSQVQLANNCNPHIYRLSDK